MGRPRETGAFSLRQQIDLHSPSVYHWRMAEGSAYPTASKSMSDHHHRLALYERQQALEEAEIKKQAMAIADAAMAAVDAQLDLQGQDWERLHRQISNHVNDILWSKGE